MYHCRQKWHLYNVSNSWTWPISMFFKISVNYIVLGVIHKSLYLVLDTEYFLCYPILKFHVDLCCCLFPACLQLAECFLKEQRWHWSLTKAEMYPIIAWAELGCGSCCQLVITVCWTQWNSWLTRFSSSVGANTGGLFSWASLQRERDCYQQR